MAAKEAALDEADRQFREEWEQRMGPVPGLSRTAASTAANHIRLQWLKTPVFHRVTH